jgi:hypothetical protein
VLSNPTNQERVNVVTGIVYLDHSTVVSNSELLHVEAPGSQSVYHSITKWFAPLKPDEEITFNQSYSLSFWAYVNPTSLTQETEIFNYGGGKPALKYANDERSVGQYIAYFTNVNSSANTYRFTLPQQKWHYFVYSYVNGNCELYINGELVYIADLNEYQPTYSVSDTMKVGQEKGLYGAVCNVNYYENPLTLAQIVTTYNLLYMHNPPIFVTENVDNTTTWYDYFNLNLLLMHNNTLKRIP